MEQLILQVEKLKFIEKNCGAGSTRQLAAG